MNTIYMAKDTLVKNKCGLIKVDKSMEGSFENLEGLFE